MNPTLLTTQWQRLPEVAIRRLQAEKLRRYLRDVVLPFSARYRGLFRELGLTADSIRSLDDLAKLPFTSKADLLDSPDHPQQVKDFLLIPDERILARRPSTLVRALFCGRESVKHGFESEFRPIFMTSTTGRAADPIPFLFTQHDLSNLAVTGRRLFEVCGARREWRLLNLFPYAPHLAFWQTHYGGTEFGVFTAGTGGGKVMGTEGNLRFIRKLNPDVLIGMPTFIYHVLHLAVEEGVRCENLKRIVLGGEKAPDGVRRKLRDLAAQLGAKSIDVAATYGFTEAKMAWANCACPVEQTPSGYHLYPDLGVIEIVDPHTGQVKPDGQPGEIVFTPLDARGTVVLRYRTGDFIDGGLTFEPCPYCGRCVPRLFGRISRSSEFKTMQLDKVKGTLVDFNQLEHVLDDAPGVGAWQLELRKRHDDPLEVDELVLHVQKTNGIDDGQLRRDLNGRFAAQTEVRLNRIIFHTAEGMRALQGVGSQLKEQMVVDHRPCDFAALSVKPELLDIHHSFPTTAAHIDGKKVEVAK
jgi:phenylacetate-coenzyme A ligase PaaK-like adenylate-forming protein